MSGISSIQGNQLFSGTTNRTYNVSVSTAEGTKKVSQDKEEGVTTSKDGDTLEISAAATALAQKNYSAMSASAGTVSKDEGYTDTTAEIMSNAAASAGITEETAAKNEMSMQASVVSGSTSGTSSGSTSNLSSYSASELKEMLQNGEITQAEYDAEMASRSGSSTTESSDESETVNETGEAEA